MNNINSDNYQSKAREILKSVTIGEPVFHGGLTIFPLKFHQGVAVEHVILEDALKSGQVEITEVSEGGSVPELLFRNDGGQNVLLVDGEELVGAKQNRILNISILVAAGMTINIPVSCVEAGRWGYRSRTFDSGSYAPTSMRSRTRAETMTSDRMTKTHMSNQRRVWDDVDHLMADFATESESSAMHESFEALDGKMANYEKALQLPPDANGYVACIGDRVLGGDLFASADVLHRKWERLSRSSIIEALRVKGEGKQTDAKTARSFIDSITAAVAESYSPPGVGTGVHIDGREVVGNVLLSDDAALHISLFARV